MLEIFDAILIRLYLVTGSPLWDYFIGTFLLALLCVFVGHWTISLVFRVNRNHLKHLDDRLTTLNRLSATAEERQDRQSYKALNKEANDAYGHLFFNRFGLSAALLWPAVFALAWMQQRFAEIAIPIPLLGFKANYFVVFLVPIFSLELSSVEGGRSYFRYWAAAQPRQKHLPVDSRGYVMFPEAATRWFLAPKRKSGQRPDFQRT